MALNIEVVCRWKGGGPLINNRTCALCVFGKVASYGYVQSSGTLGGARQKMALEVS